MASGGLFLGSVALTNQLDTLTVNDPNLDECISTQVVDTVPNITDKVLQVSDRLLERCVDIGNSFLKVESVAVPSTETLNNGPYIASTNLVLDNQFGTSKICLFGTCTNVSGNLAELSIFYSLTNPNNSVDSLTLTSLGVIPFASGAGAISFSRDFVTSAPFIVVRISQNVSLKLFSSILK